MEEMDEIKNCWTRGKVKTGKQPLKDENLKGFIQVRLKRERKVIFEYFWASLVWQITVYAFASHFIVRFWGDWDMMLLPLAGALLFIPFTVTFMRKYKSIAIASAVTKDISGSLRYQHEMLSGFFRFKKRFDWISVPVVCLMIVIVIFKLYVPGGVASGLVGVLITLALVLTPFIVATSYENKKRFREPLEQLDQIIKDLERESVA